MSREPTGGTRLALPAEDDALGPALVAALQQLPTDALPLHQAASQGGWIAEQGRSISLLSLQADDAQVRARVAVFFTELVGGCNCHDDPFEVNGYCELAIQVDRTSGRAGFSVLPG